MLAKNFREVSLSAQFLEMADWILLALEPQIVFESAGLAWLLDCHQLGTPLDIPSIPSNIPDDLQNTGRGLRGNHNVSQSHNGNGKDGLVEEHDERWEIGDREIGNDSRIGFKIAQRVWSKRMCGLKSDCRESVGKVKDDKE